MHNFQWIVLPIQSCLVLYSFCANLLYLLMWLIVSSLSTHNLHLLFCCVVSILALIWLVLIALFWAALIRDWVSFLRFPFLSHILVFSLEMSFFLSIKMSIKLFFFPFLFSSYYYYYYYYYYYCEFSDGLSLVSKWQEVYPALQEPTQYSGWS